MFAEKRARILSAACGVSAALFLSASAHAQKQVFVDNFNNGSILNSDTQAGFWQTVVDGNSTITEPTGGPETLTAVPANSGDGFPFAQLSSASLQSSFNFFQQPIVLQVSGLNYTAASSANSLTEFNFGSQLPSQAGPVETEYNEPSDFSLELLPLGSANGQIVMGEKANRTNSSSPWDSFQLIGPIGPSVYGTKYGTQTFTGQVRSFELVLSSQFYYLSVVSDTSPTNPTPVTTNYFSAINLMNTGQFPWTTGAYAPGDPALNVETQIGGSNGADQAALNMSQLKVSQMTLTYTNGAGDGNFFTPGNWSGLAVDATTAATLKINIPDYTSASATFAQASAPTAVAINNGNGNTITIGSINFNSTQPYTLNGNIVQLATSGSTGQINVTAGTQTINAELLTFDAHDNLNVAANSTLNINGPVFGNGALGLAATGAGAVNIVGNVTSNAGDMTISSGTGPLTITGDFASFGAITLNAGAGQMTINGGTNNDFLFHGAVTLNVASGGTLTINSFIDDPFNNGTPPGIYPLSKTGPGLANVSSLFDIPSVTVSGGTLRILPSTTANNFQQGGSLVYGLSLSGGKFDLTNNDLVINYSGSSPLVTIRGYLQTGTLFSSTASLAHGTTIAYAEATEINQVGSFNGLQTDSTSLALMYTYEGDLNMDGIVNSADFALMNNGNGTDWFNGDLNYDGVKNADDWALYQLGVAASARGNINNLPAPEPTSLAMLGMLGIGLMKRKRR
jgi:hypothetical protein